MRNKNLRHFKEKKMCPPTPFLLSFHAIPSFPPDFVFPPRSFLSSWFKWECFQVRPKLTK